jgi:DNA-binding PadR family transcriptional regulator
MTEASLDREHLSGSPLRGVVLALLVEASAQGVHGYMLTTLVERRLGPAWGITRQSVYGALRRLEKEELVSSSLRAGASAGGRGHARQIFTAERSAEAALAAWMEGPIGREPVRAVLLAKIAVSRAEDAPRLLATLDAYERECFELLRQTNEAEVPKGSWTALAMNLTRAAVDEGLQARLRWVTIARRWIEDHLAEQAREATR